ncbi:MAG TPA: response regulator transcription factor [Chitinivibrionales bacterium]|nr:response regulator transcription factor [Chitinivibrionales bacterium]
MAREHILIVEDEEEIQELISYNLTKEGFRTAAALSGEEALKKARAERFDLVLLDLMLPGMDGLDVCKALRKDEKTQTVPVIMLTAKGEESDIVTGLELGADDYVVKPFSPKVLVARIRTVLRRKSAEPFDESKPVEIHDLSIHPGRREVLFKKKPVPLTNMEFRVLHFLASRPGWVFSRYQIVEGVRGDNYPVTDRSVDVLIVGLRKKLDAAGAYVETVRGVGYRFKEEA